MTINHFGVIFKDYIPNLEWQIVYLTIGKITFPIMAYLLTIGLKYTKSKFNYLGRLFLYGVISIIPFHITIGYTYHNNIYFLNNILFTLSFGLLLIILIDEFKLKSIYQYILLISITLITINSDWNIIGVIMIYMFYKQPNEISKNILIIAITITIMEYIATQNIISLTNLGILLSIPLIKNTDLKKENANNLKKHLFYMYYPFHLILLYVIHSLIK